jgi:hypothetical protein
MRARQPTGYVGDSCALIDLLDANESVLSLIVQHLAPLIVITPVLGEIAQLDVRRCVALGPTVVEPSLEQLDEAADPHPGLSFADRLCLIVARDGGLVCLTNDGPLGAECITRGVATERGLRPLITLVRLGVLTAEAAIATVQRVATSNSYVTEAVVADFIRQAREASERRRRT